ncbi:T6SS immunity protein Tli4 family protein [Yersinia frederiksenii]|uniref:T6SS immunity protein Tli4 family protein n=1 Tax=Yersinia frederiksenii TaxID=29484 RepID=UPI0005E384C3|nr:T6SS immunity protein Tli4 family protein [Yersinia frederiksenii]CQH58815.1 Uncharacterised protein [Yersinia frederiksenii]
MKIKNKILIYTLVVLVLAGSVLWFMYGKTPTFLKAKLTDKEQLNMDYLLSDLQTRCIGRYLIDLPSSYSNSGNDLIKIKNSKIITNRVYQPAFEQFIRLREQELLATKNTSSIDMPYLKNTYPLPNGLKGIIFERVESLNVDDAFRVLEAYLYSNGVLIKIEIKLTNGMADRYKNDRNSYPTVYQDTTSERMSELNDLLVRIQGRNENIIPTMAGNCIPNAFITDNKIDQESIDTLYKSSNASQLRFGISTDNYIKENDSLLDRSGEIEHNLLSSDGYILRKGTRKINKLDTEELLAAGKYSSNNNKRYDFILLTNEKNGGLKTPIFSLELLNDELTPSPYSQDEIVSFWDAISQTLRVRPGAFSPE